MKQNTITAPKPNQESNKSKDLTELVASYNTKSENEQHSPKSSNEESIQENIKQGPSVDFANRFFSQIGAVVQRA